MDLDGETFSMRAPHLVQLGRQLPCTPLKAHHKPSKFFLAQNPVSYHKGSAGTNGVKKGGDIVGSELWSMKQTTLSRGWPGKGVRSGLDLGALPLGIFRPRGTNPLPKIDLGGALS